MAVISASRKTDIPTYFSEWFLNCLEKGEFYIKNNPYDPRAVTHITFNKEDIDCIVFWTKNPGPMLSKIEKLNEFEIPYYFQFTITGYDEELEPNIPDRFTLIEQFRKLSKLTNGRVIWRYDPIIINDKYTFNRHLMEFSYIAEALEDFTDRCVISFVDLYSHLGNQFKDINEIQSNRQDFINFCKELAYFANVYNMQLFTCAEDLAFEDIGIKRGSCIDKELIEKFCGYEIKVNKDKGQRTACLCAESIDVGRYNTCKNGCLYCYAGKNPSDINKNFSKYNSNSTILCDEIKPTDIITEKKLKSLRRYSELSIF